MKTNHQRGYVAPTVGHGDGARLYSVKMPSGNGSRWAAVDEPHNGAVSQAGRVRAVKRQLASLVRRDAKQHIADQLKESMAEASIAETEEQ